MKTCSKYANGVSIALKHSYRAKLQKKFQTHFHVWKSQGATIQKEALRIDMTKETPATIENQPLKKHLTPFRVQNDTDIEISQFIP